MIFAVGSPRARMRIIARPLPSYASDRKTNRWRTNRPDQSLAYSATIPIALGSRFEAEVCTQDAWPLDTRLHLQEPPLLVKVADSVHPAHIQERPAAQELLSTHRVPSAGNRHGPFFNARSLDGANNVTECVRLNFSRHASEIQSGMDVVELSRMGFCATDAFLCFHARIVVALEIYCNTTQKRITFQYQRGMRVILWRLALKT
jgi:hypothetical protein